MERKGSIKIGPSHQETSMNKEIEIHETAFMTSTYRAMEEALSKDHYAKLWRNEKTDHWIKEYCCLVSEEEPYLHCLRNRYFLEQLQDLIKQEAIEVLINFGCGFSMYPFLLPAEVLHIEIDQPDVLEYKKEKIAHWQSEGRLPVRNIHYIGKDFNQADNAPLIDQINQLKGTKRTFILIEGVLFFLSRADTIRLFDLFAELQTSGDFVGSVSFTDTIVETAVFQRLIRFCEDKLNFNQQFEFQTVPTSFYEALAHYQLIDHQQAESLSQQFAPDRVVRDGTSVLNEHMYLLKKA